MKLLVIGIDGGDRRIIEAMEMPHLQRMMSEGQCVSITEDLWSRGWAETLTGTNGLENGGFYMKPVCEGERKFIETYRGDDYLDPPNFMPIWTKLNQAGQRVGFMNVPTTSPVPEVDGFIVGGAGGGRGGGSGVDPLTCWPRELAPFLEECEYLFDTRFLQNQPKSFDEFFGRLQKMAVKRTDTYIELCKQHQVDMGYLAYMSTSRAQYLAMSELEPLVARTDMAAVENQRSASLRPIQKQLVDLFRSLDEQIARLVDELKPDHWLVVADHGAVSMTHVLNLNAFLRRMGAQKTTGGAGAKSTLKKIARALIPARFRATVGKQARSVVKVLAADTDWDRTKAFCYRFYGGIYVNDADRFGGPVRSEAEIAKITDSIVEAFNASPEAAEHGMQATAYRRHHPNVRFERLLPDVMVDAPDGYFYEHYGPFVERNRKYRPLESIAEVTNDMFSGMKGKHPLLSVDAAAAEHIQDDDPNDLRLAYRLMERIMAS